MTSPLLLKRWRLIVGETPSFDPSTQFDPTSSSDSAPTSNLDSPSDSNSPADANSGYCEDLKPKKTEENENRYSTHPPSDPSTHQPKLSSDSCAWSSNDQKLDHLLNQLYPPSSSPLPSYSSSSLTPPSSEHTFSDDSQFGFESQRSVSISELLDQTRSLFSPSVVHIIQHDLIDRLGIQALLEDPQTLQTLDPDLPLIVNLLQSQTLLNQQQKQGVHLLIDRALKQLLDFLKVKHLPQLRGQLDRRFKTKRPALKDLHWPKSIRKNLHLYSPETQALILAKRIGFKRKRKGAELDTLILCVDQSGSMTSSVIYATLFASILSQIPSIQLHLILFNTQVYQLEHRLSDPVDLILNLKFGGGTQIHHALKKCTALCIHPKDTHLILISDLYENGSSDLFLNEAHHLMQMGVNFITLLALNDEGTPSYHRGNAHSLAKSGSPTFTATPDQFPHICSLALNRIPFSQWPPEFTLHHSL